MRQRHLHAPADGAVGYALTSPRGILASQPGQRGRPPPFPPPAGDRGGALAVVDEFGLCIVGAWQGGGAAGQDGGASWVAGCGSIVAPSGSDAAAIPDQTDREVPCVVMTEPRRHGLGQRSTGAFASDDSSPAQQ